jgi:hypothetical protein
MIALALTLVIGGLGSVVGALALTTTPASAAPSPPYLPWRCPGGGAYRYQGVFLFYFNPSPAYDTQAFTLGVGGECQMGKSRLVMQTDGNLVLYDEFGGVRFSSNTWGNPGSYLTFQDDGNLVVYNGWGPYRRVLWSPNTWGARPCGCFLAIQEDGNVVIYNQGMAVRWSTNTWH